MSIKPDFHKIGKDKLCSLLEPHFHQHLKQNLDYEVRTIKARDLLSHTRFDLAFKLIYLEMIDKDVKFAEDIYCDHIRAFGLGKFHEFGNEGKNSSSAFVKDFKKVFRSIEKDGFDDAKTLIPLSKSGYIANGSHRVASAIYLDQEVRGVQIPDAVDHIYDYRFFYGRKISREALEVAAVKFVEYAENIYMAFIWPSARGRDDEIMELIPNIVYRKDVDLNLNGAHNIMSQIYYGEEWLGSVEDHFAGAGAKVAECFRNSGPMRVFAFQAGSAEEVVEIKERIRKLFDVGKGSIHITDTREEASMLAQVVFNDNSIHFLNYGQPSRYLSTYAKIAELKDFIKTNRLDSNRLVLDGGMVLSAYGLRETSDIDYFVDTDSKLHSQNDQLEQHDSELCYHGKDKLELIYNPQHYFYFNGLKIISLSQLDLMKKRRGEEKDMKDCRMMADLVKKYQLKKVAINRKQQLLFLKTKSKLFLIRILEKTGLFPIAKFIKNLGGSILHKK